MKKVIKGILIVLAILTVLISIGCSICCICLGKERETFGYYN
ncbi:MAG: hypothetical protein VZS44_11180 [Bacilli bacterium]|nr:hypothetical protein [Bacilli bacterium]